MKRLIWVGILGLGLVVFAEIPALQITNLRAQQRYPWNGKVDISFDVSCAQNDSGMLMVRAIDISHNSSILMRSFTLDGAPRESLFGLTDFDGRVKCLVTQLNGAHQLVWDSSVDYPEVETTRLTYEISILRSRGPVPDAIGDANGLLGDVIVLDLEALMQDRGAEESITFLYSVDLGKLNCEAYEATKMAFVKFMAGTYVVGTGETATSPVRLTRDYCMGMHQVTRAQYKTVMGSDPSSTGSSEGDLAPVQAVSWTKLNNSNDFLAKINSKLLAIGCSFQIQLPTEAQWEIAARCGTTSPWFFGATDVQLEDYAWFDLNAANKSHTVGTKRANPCGLYDMYGNIWEWCADWHGGSYPSSTDDPIGDATGSERIVRGGSYGNASTRCCSTFRSWRSPDVASRDIGFRGVLAPRTH